MKSTYKGFEIIVKRDKCLGGWSMLYYDVFRIKDGYHLVGNFEDSAETVRGKIKQCKDIVDDYLADPKSYDE
jgi:hypothetical protein